MSNTTIISGQLQIDHERGVIYFHADKEPQESGICPTPLRICGMGNIQYPIADRQIDLTIRPLNSFSRKDKTLLINEVGIIK